MNDDLWTCQDCGMACATREFHPFAACLMYRECGDARTVRTNLAAVLVIARSLNAPDPLDLLKSGMPGEPQP